MLDLLHATRFEKFETEQKKKKKCLKQMEILVTIFESQELRFLP